jgi:hypothetical protein
MPRARDVFIFIAHQLVATLGVSVAAGFATAVSFGMLRLLDSGLFSSHNAYWLATEVPYFPVQIIWGFWLGWLLQRRLQHRSMLWVWVLPFLSLCYAIVVGPIFILHPDSIIVQAGGGFSSLSHYFGQGCGAKDLCLDQLVFTMPFYASVAYAFGALLARKVHPRINSPQRESMPAPA